MKLKLHTRIFIGVVLGIISGFIIGVHVTFLDTLSILFVRLLSLVVVPLMISSIITTILTVGNITKCNRLTKLTVGYYALTTIMAVILAMALALTIQPGNDTPLSTYNPKNAMMGTLTHQPLSLLELSLEIVPDNIMKALMTTQMLSIIFFSCLLGCALVAIGERGEPVAKVIGGFQQVMIKITRWVIELAPIGVFALLASLVGQLGAAAFKPLAYFMLTVLLGLGIHSGIFLTGIAKLWTKLSPLSFLKTIKPALFSAFITDSSVMTLPVSIKVMESEMKLPQKIVRYVLALGASLNLNGTSLYSVIAALFIAQVYDISLTVTQLLIVALTAMLAAIGTAGIPGAGLIVVVVVLKAVDLPVEGVGLILAVDRILDMCRTSVDVYGDLCGSVIINKWYDSEPLLVDKKLKLKGLHGKTK